MHRKDEDPRRSGTAGEESTPSRESPALSRSVEPHPLLAPLARHAPLAPPATTRHRMTVARSAAQERPALVVWVEAALERGDLVLVKHLPEAARHLQEVFGAHGMADAMERHAVEFVDTPALGRHCGGKSALIGEWHRLTLHRALREGFQGLTMTGDGAALQALTADRDEFLAHERDISAMIEEGPVHALCRYHRRLDAAVLSDILDIHHDDVVEDTWSACVADGVLRLRGEFDLENADRLRVVLLGAVADGVLVVDMTGVEFCAVAGVNALLDAAETLDHDRQLNLVGVRPVTTRIIELMGSTSRLRVAPGQEIR